MCELLGICSNLFTNLRYSSEVMSQHSRKHPHGWGVAFYPPLHNDTDIASKQCKLFKEEISMNNSDLIRYLNDENIIKSTNFQGYDSTHPFVRELFGQHWSFTHSGAGGLDNYFSEYFNRNNLKLDFTPIGFTGSDKAFCIILNELKKVVEYQLEIRSDNRNNQEVICKYDFDKAQKVIFQTCKKIMDSGANLNILLSNGEYLIAFHSGYNKLNYVYRDNRSFSEINDSDFSSIGLVKEPGEKSIVIATEKLTNENWIPFEKGEMLIFKDGQLVYRNGEKLNNNSDTENSSFILDVEVYDSTSWLDSIDPEKRVIEMPSTLRKILQVEIGDEVKILNGEKELTLKVFKTDKDLLKDGNAQADNPNKHACLPRKIRDDLGLTVLSSLSRENLPRFKKKFSSISIQKV